MFLRVENSNYSGNTAVGGLIGCPTGSQSSEPCSTWGGAIAVFEILNVSVTGCSMTDNTAVADVPAASPQTFLSRNAVAGGGCVSVLFRGNCSAFVLYMSGNSFLRCTVDVSRSRNIVVGNGMYDCLKSSCFVVTLIISAAQTYGMCRIRRRIVRLRWPVGGTAATERLLFQFRPPKQRVFKLRCERRRCWRKLLWRRSVVVHRRIFVRVFVEWRRCCCRWRHRGSQRECHAGVGEI